MAVPRSSARSQWKIPRSFGVASTSAAAAPLGCFPFERPDLADLLVSDLCARLQVFAPSCAFLVAQGGSPGVFAMHISANHGLLHLQL